MAEGGFLTMEDTGAGSSLVKEQPRESQGVEAGCSQEEGPKKGFVMGSRTRGVQEILEKYI